MRLNLLYSLLVSVAAAAFAPCVYAQSSDVSTSSRPPVEGRYESCPEAFMHSEQLELRAGRFLHHIATDVPPSRTSSGSYAVHRDTLILPLEVDEGIQSLRNMHAEGGTSRERLNELFPAEKRMIIDELKGHPVLWRTPAMKAEFSAGRAIRQYDLLVRVAGDDLRLPSCRALGILP